MEPFVRLTAQAVCLDIAKIDTGMILPGRFMRKPRRPGEATYAEAFLHDLRFTADGEPQPDCVLNDPSVRGAKILVTAADFGCGSSREGAAYAVLDYGLRALIGPSFGDIFYANCVQNGVLPVILAESHLEQLRSAIVQRPHVPITIDLPAQRVTASDGGSFPFEIDAERKTRLLEGLDDVGVTLKLLPQIESFEAGHARRMPWFEPLQPS